MVDRMLDCLKRGDDDVMGGRKEVKKWRRAKTWVSLLELGSVETELGYGQTHGRGGRPRDACVLFFSPALVRRGRSTGARIPSIGRLLMH